MLQANWLILVLGLLAVAGVVAFPMVTRAGRSLGAVLVVAVPIGLLVAHGLHIVASGL